MDPEPVGRVTDNVADQSGGGVALVGAALSGGPVVIASNVAGEGGGIHVDGVPGAVPFPGTADLVNAVLQNNLAQGNGGAMAAVTPAGLGAFPSRLTLVGDVDACGWAAGFPPNRYCAELRANEALSGGGVYLRDADAVLEQVAASYNTGSNISAIQLVAGSNMDMDNCLLETDGGSVDTIRVENPGTFDAINSTFAGSGLRVVYLAGTVGNLDCNVFGDPGAGGPSLFVDPTAAVNGVDNAGFGVVSIVPPAGGSNLNNPAPLFAAAAPHRHRLDPLSPAVGICKNVLPFDLVGVSRLDDPGAFELP